VAGLAREVPRPLERVAPHGPRTFRGEARPEAERLLEIPQRRPETAHALGAPGEEIVQVVDQDVAFASGKRQPDEAAQQAIGLPGAGDRSARR
jgi:hypothetical protein